MPTVPETRWAKQSVDLSDVLDSLAILFRKSLGWAEERVIEWHWGDRPNVDVGRPVVWFGFADGAPDADSGAGRHGMKNLVRVSVSFTTRGFKDGNHKDKKLARDHWAAHYYLQNGLIGRMLHDAYDDRIDNEPPKATQTANVLSVGTMVTREIPAPKRPRPEAGYIETRFELEIPCVLRLTLADAPVLEKKVFPKDA